MFSDVFGILLGLTCITHHITLHHITYHLFDTYKVFRLPEGFFIPAVFRIYTPEYMII